MIKLEVILEGDGAFKDIDPRKIMIGEFFRITALPHGTKSGLPSIAIGIRLDDGTVVIGETSARALVIAAVAIKARYPEIDSD